MAGIFTMYKNDFECVIDKSANHTYLMNKNERCEAKPAVADTCFYKNGNGQKEICEEFSFKDDHILPKSMNEQFELGLGLLTIWIAMHIGLYWPVLVFKKLSTSFSPSLRKRHPNNLRQHHNVHRLRIRQYRSRLPL